MTMILAPDEGRLFPIGGDRVRVKGVADALGVGFAVIDYRAAPGIPGPPLHVHDDIDEAWYLLEGRLDVCVGDDRRTVGAGSFLLVPHGASHTFANVGDEWARWIGVLSPGSSLGMLEDLGRLIPEDGPPDEAAITEMFARYGTTVLGPPLS
jgi:mannose-6-phosphate isomerase-like protein (cupin superfamily)